MLSNNKINDFNIVMSLWERLNWHLHNCREDFVYIEIFIDINEIEDHDPTYIIE